MARLPVGYRILVDCCRTGSLALCRYWVPAPVAAWTVTMNSSLMYGESSTVLSKPSAERARGCTRQTQNVVTRYHVPRALEDLEERGAYGLRHLVQEADSGLLLAELLDDI